MTEFLKIVSDFLAAFFDQPPRILIVLGLVFFGYGLKRSPISDRWIPFVLPALGIFLFPIWLGEGRHTWGFLGVQGFVGGSLAVWINQAWKQFFTADGKDQPLILRLLAAFQTKQIKLYDSKNETADPPVNRDIGVSPGPSGGWDRGDRLRK